MRIRTLVIPAGGFALPARGGRVARTRSTSTSGPDRDAQRTGAGSLSPTASPLPTRRITVGIVD